MNKVALVITVVAAYASLSYGIPAPKAVNWPEVAAKVGEIQTVVGNSTSEIKTVASSDNEQVGSSVGSKVDNFVGSARDVLERVNAAVASESLTEVQAQGEVSTLKGNLARLIGSLQSDLAQLTPTASQQIVDIVSATFDAIELKAEELYVLLQAGTATSTTSSSTSV